MEARLKPDDEATEEPSFYEQLMAIDVIDPILDAHTRGHVKGDLESMKLSIDYQIGLSRTWVFATTCPHRNCGKWLQIYHKYYKILPPPCLQCWKVVYAPQTIVELMAIREFQAKLALPAKCGLEKRDYTSAIGQYRAFWYCPFHGGLKQGRAHFARIKSALIKEFDEEIVEKRIDENRFFLKRGCTELERDFGPSDEWEQHNFEPIFKLLETVWEDPPNMDKEWAPLVYSIMKRWIEFAVGYGDKSVIEYLPKKMIDAELGVPSIKYHSSDHQTDQFKNYIVPLNGTGEGDDVESSETKSEESLFGFEPAESKRD